MPAPDMQQAIAFISGFMNLYMLFAGIAIVFLIFVAIADIGFRKGKPVKVFVQLFIRVLALWVIASCLLVVVAAQLMTSAWDGIVLIIDLLGDKIAEGIKGVSL
ncbi:MAG: hypothetical protein WB502_12230 [Thermoactinomyces sp.]